MPSRGTSSTSSANERQILKLPPNSASKRENDSTTSHWIYNEIIGLAEIIKKILDNLARYSAWIVFAETLVAIRDSPDIGIAEPRGIFGWFRFFDGATKVFTFPGLPIAIAFLGLIEPVLLFFGV